MALCSAGARSWVQRPDRQNKLIAELTRGFREDAFPGYTHFVANVSEVPALPATWASALRAARGIYLLSSARTKEQYVGSATGGCHAPGCTATVLCRAHIVPQGFARTLSEPGGHNRAVRATGSKPANQPNGQFDPAILCGPCDGRLGLFDAYAIDFCDALPRSVNERTGSPLQREPFDGTHFAKAMLAILWRASISARVEWSDISFGPYEGQAADILFGDNSLADQDIFEIVLLRYASRHLDTRKFIFHPIHIRSGPLNMYAMGVGGFLVLTKVDQRSFHTPMRPYLIAGASRLETVHIRFEETGEFDFFRRAAAEERKRKVVSTRSPR